MNLVELYRSETNRGILFRWFVNITIFCLAVLLAAKISGWSNLGGHDGPTHSEMAVY